MEKEQIAETVQKCGEAGQRAAEGYLIKEGINSAPDPARSAQWMQAKMLGEIAYQLAVMNERGRACGDAENIQRSMSSASVIERLRR